MSMRCSDVCRIVGVALVFTSELLLEGRDFLAAAITIVMVVPERHFWLHRALSCLTKDDYWSTYSSSC